MSLRVRLSLILGSAFVIIWVLAAAWMLRDLRQQMMFSLDQRLVASARMVAGLIDQLPQPLTAKGGEAHFSADQFSVPDGMACQVSSLRGEILASNHKHDGAMDDERSGFRDQTIDDALWRTFTYNHGDVRITTADRHMEREALNQQMAASPKGARIGQWMLKHEEALKQRLDLQVPERRKGAAKEPQPMQPNRPEGKDKEPPTGKPGSMPLHTVACFKADKLPASKHAEFERQLKGQQDGLNRLTVEEFLENVANPVKRDPRVAKVARLKLQRELQERLQRELSQHMSPLEAEKLAFNQAKETMASIAALHNPDLVAGGKDIISGFGDKQVNSTIGPQWKGKVTALTSAAKQVPLTEINSTKMNVKLHKC